MADLRPQLLGRGTYGPHRLPWTQGPQHLWNHVSMPPMQNSIIIYTDGTVLEGNNFEPWEYDPVWTPTAHRFIMGGANIRCDDLDQFSRDALHAAGYTCGFGHDVDAYPSNDQYPDPDVYPIEGTP